MPRTEHLADRDSATAEDFPDAAYRALAAAHPAAPRLGGALIAVAQPWKGHERAFNRWYEDDHLYTGAAGGPHCAAARRFVSPRSLRDPSPGGSPGGAFLALYWLLPALVPQFREWAGATVEQMLPAGRMFAERTLVHASFARLARERRIDPEPMTALHALDHPYGGLVMEVVDFEGDEAAALDRIETELMPLEDETNVGQVLAFAPDSPAESGHATVIWFLHDAPGAGWFDAFRTHRGLLSGSGVARQRFVTAYVPTVPGTDAHLSEIS